MATITEWLASLGLSEYAQRFAENDVDVTVLRHLTDQDLKEIGISLGHRRKILASIAELTGDAATRSQPAAPPEPKPGDDPERRQLMVMITDLVGSTALSTKLSRTPDSGTGQPAQSRASTRPHCAPHPEREHPRRAPSRSWS